MSATRVTAFAGEVCGDELAVAISSCAWLFSLAHVFGSYRCEVAPGLQREGCRRHPIIWRDERT